MGSNSRAASSFFFFYFLLLLFLFASLPCWKPAAAASSPGRRRAACNETEGGGGRRCRVEVKEEDAEEFQFDSEINRRLLAGSDPTPGPSNRALDPNKPPCYAKNGKPYNCAAMADKPPVRGCSIYNLCRNSPPGAA